MATVLGMSTPPGNYDNLDALAAAPVEPGAPLADASAATPPQSVAPVIALPPAGNLQVSMPGLYITPDDTIQFTCVNGNPALTSIAAVVRVLRPDGSIETQPIVITGLTSDRVANVALAPQMDGWILGIRVGQLNAGTSRGQTYTTVALIRGSLNNPLFTITLVQDYVSSNFKPSWPYGALRSAVDGPGFITTYAGVEPAAGADCVVQQPPAVRWRVISATTTLVTNAVVSNRSPTLQLASGGVVVGQYPTAAVVPASSTINLTWASGLTPLGPFNNYQAAPLPEGAIIAASGVVSTLTQAIEAGDQYHFLTLLVEEWIDV
jgi:hypothetical protein